MPAGYDPCPAVFVDIYDAYLLATGEIAQNSVLGGGSKPYVKGGGGVHCKGLKLAYIKVGSNTKKLHDFPEVEAKLWDRLRNVNFESRIAKFDLELQEVAKLLETSVYIEMRGMPQPANMEGAIHYLMEEELVLRQDNGLFVEPCCWQEISMIFPGSPVRRYVSSNMQITAVWTCSKKIPAPRAMSWILKG